jgi:hypothetical protein
MGWWVLRKCFVACLFLEESQQPTCPQVRQRRRWTHSSPVFRQSSQPRALGVTSRISLKCVQVAIALPPSAGETGEVLWLREQYGEDVASHTGLESCMSAREDGREPWTGEAQAEHSVAKEITPGRRRHGGRRKATVRIVSEFVISVKDHPAITSSTRRTPVESRRIRRCAPLPCFRPGHRGGCGSTRSLRRSARAVNWRHYVSSVSLAGLRRFGDDHDRPTRLGTRQGGA